MCEAVPHMRERWRANPCLAPNKKSNLHCSQLQMLQRRVIITWASRCRAHRDTVMTMASPDRHDEVGRASRSDKFPLYSAARTSARLCACLELSPANSATPAEWVTSPEVANFWQLASMVAGS